MNLLISIIIPVYNVAPYLDRCLRSVCGQTYEHIEIIVVDDGSTDGSPSICDDWAQNDQRIHVIHKENGGLSDARNTGLLAAKGEYILYVDSDDYMEITACENLLRYTADQPDLIAAAYYFHTPDGTVILNRQLCFTDGETVDAKDYIIRGRKNKNTQCLAWTYMYRRAFLLENGLLYRKGWIAEDVDLEYRLLTSANRITVAHCPIYHHLLRAGSITTVQCSWKRIHDVVGIQRRALQFWDQYDDPELGKYMVSETIHYYLGVCPGLGICGWRPLGIGAGYALIHTRGFRGRVRVVYRELKFLVFRISGKAIYPGKEFSETVSDDYVRKALILSSSPEKDVLNSVETLRRENPAVTPATDLRGAEESKLKLRDQGVHVVNMTVSDNLRTRGKLRKLLSNGYEVVLCRDRKILKLAAQCGKICADRGLTVFEEMDG